MGWYNCVIIFVLRVGKEGFDFRFSRSTRARINLNVRKLKHELTFISIVFSTWVCLAPGHEGKSEIANGRL